MVNRFSRSLISGFGLWALLSGGAVQAAESTAERLQRLEQEMIALKRELEAERKAERAAANSAKVDLGSKGLKVTSSDAHYSLRIRGYLQADGRTFISDDEDLGLDDLLIRRARPIIEGTAGDFSFRIMPDFGGTATRLFDAYAEYRPSKIFGLRAGKFKSPVSLDRLRSATDLNFVERSLPTNLAPNRDIGLLLFGEPIPGYAWELGIFNGAEDLGISTGDSDDEKEFAARLFAHPFSGTDSALKGLGIGAAGTWGQKEGSPANRQVGDYRSPAQARVFRYRTSTFADGDHWRIAPQGYFHLGPFGLQAEYTVSKQEVRNGDARAEIENTAWETQLRWVLTGEDAGYCGWPVPAHPFNPARGQWGAWEIAVKYGELEADEAAFPVFADPASAIEKASNFGIALHGYLTANVGLVVDYEHTWFDGGAVDDTDRETEQVVLARLNYRF